MKPSFHPRLTNDPFSDPGLYIPFLFEHRAILFDLGELYRLSPRDLMKVTHVFVTHTHMDHFIGFDHLLRVLLGRDKTVHFFGPPGFSLRVEGKLAGYTWNLVNEYRYHLRLKVSEVHPARIVTREYLCRKGFHPDGIVTERPYSGTLHEEAGFHVEAAFLDHRIPCLGLSLLEEFHVNIDKEGLKILDLPIGTWLSRFKKALHEKHNPGKEFIVTWEEKGKVIKERPFILGELSEKIARISPGQKISYITDIIGSAGNYEKVIALAENADHLFIEAGFLEQDKETAERKYHLTAREAGEIARRSGARQFTLFHFSSRYRHHEKEIYHESMEAYGAMPAG